METGIGARARLGRPLTFDEVAALLGWTEADKAAHLQARAAFPDLDPAVVAEAEARLASRPRSR